ncbi:hypothetical protein ACH6EH_06560 [Paenibacillus sp. JSM ZJ436]|uniref:hypothetical protein n=1 Tax=Paenibacillus sp. JSM ZJ436 TaxID=3376190 RepID=UPI00378A610B
MADLQILISANLNIGESIGDINTAIKALSKHKSLQKLTLKVDVDQSFVKSINQFIAATEKLGNALREQNKVVSDVTTVYKKLDGSIEKVREQHLASGEILTKINKQVDEHKQKLTEETKALDKQGKSAQALKKDLEGLSIAQDTVSKNKYGETTGTRQTYKNSNGTEKVNVNLDKDGNVNAYKVSNDLEKAIKQEEDFLEQMYQGRLKSEQQQKEFYRDWENNQQKHIDKNLELLRKDNDNENQSMIDREKMHVLALQKNAAIDKQYVDSVKATQTKIDDLRRRFSKDSGVLNGLNEVQSKLNEIVKNDSKANFKNTFSDLNADLKQLSANAKTATSHTLGLGEAFKTAMTRFPIWIFISPLR